MQIDFLNILLMASISLWIFSLGYLFAGLVAISIFKNKNTFSDDKKFQPPISILKPIYGLDPEMYINLKSFCLQNYPKYQIIFGLQDVNDEALPIVKKIIKELNDVDISFIINTERHGTNHKVSNLINMCPSIKYEFMLIADSDMHVNENYLSQVIKPFDDPNTGAITCLYFGSATKKITSMLNTMFINNWFLPSVLISKMIKPIEYCLGATMIVRRSILHKIGGFEALSNHLADDYMLGKLISNIGYKIHLSNCIVKNVVEESSFKNLILHELRWARTLRRVEPYGYALTFLTDSLILSIFAGTSLYVIGNSFVLFLFPIFITLIIRVYMYSKTNEVTDSGRVGKIWLIPLRDTLTFFIRILSYAGNSVEWRKNKFAVDHLGLMHDEKIISSEKNRENKTTDTISPQDT
ncbi:MAG: hypothetical protein CMF54_03520 [Legionellales bacterium]|nr:hypothetical protein [Legionellales bacterium]